MPRMPHDEHQLVLDFQVFSIQCGRMLRGSSCKAYCDVIVMYAGVFENPHCDRAVIADQWGVQVVL
jgi:hypothetical protein